MEQQNHSKVIFIIIGLVVVFVLIWLFVPNGRDEGVPMPNDIGVAEITPEQKESLLQNLSRSNQQQAPLTQKQKEELLKKLSKSN